MNELQSYQSLDAYRSHDLNIQMRTSSGDTINMGFSNTQSLSMEQSKEGASKSSSFSFASMQSYSFQMDSNGLDEQDKQEIQEFMQMAQPYIDDFMKELESEEQHTSMSQVARTVSDIFTPLNEKPQESKDFAKQGIVDLIDNALKQLQQSEKLIGETRTFLDKILENMNSFESMLYA